jgi:hypothetical protein
MSEVKKRSDSDEETGEVVEGRSATKKAAAAKPARLEPGRVDVPTKLHSPLLPLLWLLFPFLAMLTYGLLTRH